MKTKRKPQHEIWGEPQPMTEMNSEPKVHVWNPTRPRIWCPPGFGVDPYEQENALADAIADVAPLYVQNEVLVYLDGNKLRPVDRDVLIEIIAKYIKLPKLTNRGSESEPDWVCEHVAYEASPEMLEALLSAENWFEGNLSARLTQLENLAS